MKKIKIGLCDDESIVLQSLERMITICLEQMGKEGELFAFQSGREVLRVIKELDAVFLDIEMPDMDGIETGEQIKKMNPHCKIIMAAGQTERFKETYRFQAFRFITKPFEAEEIEETLHDVLQCERTHETIALYYERKSYHIECERIQFAEAYDGYVEFTLNKANNIFRKDISLDELERLLNKKFYYRVHKKYLINMKYINDYREKSGIIVMPDKEIRVARRRKADFEKAYVEYDIHYR